VACELGEMGGDGLLSELAVMSVGICGSGVVVDAWCEGGWSLGGAGDGDECGLDRGNGGISKRLRIV
jgi:hypothetical protein